MDILAVLNNLCKKKNFIITTFSLITFAGCVYALCLIRVVALIPLKFRPGKYLSMTKKQESNESHFVMLSGESSFSEYEGCQGLDSKISAKLIDNHKGIAKLYYE